MSEDAVVLDVVFEDGLLHLELANLGNLPAVDVTVSFDQPLVDAQGRDVSELLLFRGLAFLAPGRRIRTLLGPSSSHSENVTVRVEYAHPRGERTQTRITHDLALFRELAYVV